MPTRVEFRAHSDPDRRASLVVTLDDDIPNERIEEEATSAASLFLAHTRRPANGSGNVSDVLYVADVTDDAKPGALPITPAAVLTWIERCEAALIAARKVDPSAMLYSRRDPEGDGPGGLDVEICGLTADGRESLSRTGAGGNPEDALTVFRALPPEPVRCLNCRRTIRRDSLNGYADGRALWEDAEEQTLGCDDHPARAYFEEEDEVAPHVPETVPTVEEIRIALVFAVAEHDPDREAAAGPSNPDSIHGHAVALLRDIVARIPSPERRQKDAHGRPADRRNPAIPAPPGTPRGRRRAIRRTADR